MGYSFKNKSLLKLALTHSSATDLCNERLEFLGDSVLSMVSAEYLYSRLPGHKEGQLTKIRAGLVCEEALYNYALKIGLGEQIMMSKGEERTGGRNRKSILSDAFEALIAAIYLDSGLSSARDFIVGFLPDKNLTTSVNIVGDYKTTLQEMVQQNPDSVILYELTHESGPAHEKIFCYDVLINGEVKGSGKGQSKKIAQQQAAKHALEHFAI